MYFIARLLLVAAALMWPFTSATALETIAARQQLARRHLAEGRHADAERMVKSALVMAEEDYGPHSRELASVVQQLAVVYQAQGRIAEMEPILKRLVAIRAWHRWADPLEYAEALNLLTAYYHDTERYAEAIASGEQALQVDREALGEASAEVAADLSDLAVLHQRLGRMKEAKAFYRQSLAAWQAAAPLNPAHALTLSDYAALLRQLGQPLEAQVVEGRARTILSSR